VRSRIRRRIAIETGGHGWCRWRSILAAIFCANAGVPATRSPWLPSPVEIEPASYEPEDASADPSALYDRMESVSFAFLLALEALTPMQRAVLLLRDVFDYSAREAAEALGVSEANTRTTHLRARRAMAAYDAARQPFTPERGQKTESALKRFLNCLASGDVGGVESLLAADVKAISDGGGEFAAAKVPVVGAAKVAGAFAHWAKDSQPVTRVEIRWLNGLPAVLVERPSMGTIAPRFVIQCELDSEGLVCRIYTVLASRKLTALPVT
jgi:RNA polymerase sigma-70 factor (ECF subfamily)